MGAGSVPRPAVRPTADRAIESLRLRYPQRMVAAVLAALFLGAVATLGDFVWAHWAVRHRPVYGLIHGAVFGLAIGSAIGIRNGRLLPAAAGGLIVLVLCGGVFYALAPVLRMGAMFPAWMLFWICFALLQRQLRPEPMRDAIGRGLVAAVLSGAAFYAISGIWTDREPGGPNYARNLLLWTFAFFPGFAALFVGRRLTS